MRLLILFLLIPFVADAQIIRAEPFYRTLLRTDTLLLDSFPAAAAYSVRKLRTAYTGSCMRVRRTSNNNEQDIGFVNNYLDTATLKSFAGTSNLFVVTWYDQSGNGRDATQATAANQPRIYDSVTASIDRRNGIVSLRADGTNDRLNVSTGLDIYQNRGFGYGFSVACHTSTTVIGYLYYASTNTSSVRFGQAYNITAGRNALVVRRLDADAALTLSSSNNFSSTNLQVVTNRMEWTNNDGFIYRNGTQVGSNTSFGTTGNTSNTASLNFQLFHLANSNHFNGSCSEIVLYNTDESASRVSIENNINRNFSLY